MIKRTNILSIYTGLLGLSALASVASAAPVPGYVPPVQPTTTPAYADDTRGVFVPSHQQHRLKSMDELQSLADGASYQMAQANVPMYAQASPANDQYERRLNNISNGYGSVDNELNRIAGTQYTSPNQGYQMAQGMQQGEQVQYQQQAQMPVNQYAPQPMPMQNSMQAPQANANSYSNGGVEVAVGQTSRNTLDMSNSLVRLQEDRITVRRALQRMMDQIGGGDWAVVWDLADSNATLPDTEISVYAEEPFVNVLNALLARMQTRSGQPLRVIRYDNTSRLIITDRASGHRLAGNSTSAGPGGDKVAVTEQVLKESMVTLHYDEIPLVDALENIVNQAGKGEWRLRIYAGIDQVLKPAHVEEPFSVAMERLLKLFNLKYEIFPGGKLIVVTHNNRFGFRGQ